MAVARLTSEECRRILLSLRLRHCDAKTSLTCCDRECRTPPGARVSRALSMVRAQHRRINGAAMVEGVRKIGVVGAGTMGAGVAQAFAAAGYPVTLRDIAQAPLDRGMGAIRKSLDRLIARGKLAAADKDATLGRIKATTTIEDLADCDVVVEAVLERFDLKKAVMGDLDRVCRADAILATNTSSISVTRIAATSKAPARIIGMHFFNPVPMMQLVEIIRGLQTSDETTCAFCGASTSATVSRSRSPVPSAEGS